MHVLIALVCTETKLKSIKPAHHQICLFTKVYVLCLYNVWHVRKLLLLIYDVVEIKFTVAISLMRWPSSLLHRNVQGKQHTLPVHGEQTVSNPIFVACFSHEL